MARLNKDELKKIQETPVDKLNENQVLAEAIHYVDNPEEMDYDIFENAGSEINKLRAKQLTIQALKSREYNKGARQFISAFTEATANTGVNTIATFRKLLPEVLARSANMSLAIENVAHVVQMSSNSIVVPFHRRVIGASTSTTEALYNIIDSAFGGTGTHGNTLDPFVDSGDTDTGGVDPVVADGVDDDFTVGTGNTRVASENLTFATMSKVASRIDQVNLTAASRNSASEVSTEALQDANNEYGVNLIREGLITMQGEMYRAISAEVYARLALVARKEAAVFDFASVGTDNADNFFLKNAFLFQKAETMKAQIQADTKEPGLRFIIVATPKVISRLRMVDRLHVQVTDPKTVKRDYDNVSFYRGTVGDFELYEASEAAADFLMVVGKGNMASNSPIIYGNYIPFFVTQVPSPDTTHERFFGKIRSNFIGNPLGNDNLSELLDASQQGACKYARYLRVNNVI